MYITCTFAHIYICIYIYPLIFRFCPHICLYRVLSKLPVLYSRFLIVIYFIWTSVWPSHFSRVRLFANPVDCSPPDSSVHWVLQARILEWVAISPSRGSCRPRGWIRVPCVSCIGRWVFTPSTSWEAHVVSSMYMSIPVSRFILLSFSLGNHVCFIYLWLCLCFLNRFICTFFRFHI